METGSTDDREYSDMKCADGNRWSFVGTKDGPMIEVVRITPEGTILIAPHATHDDLRNAVHVLAELAFERLRSEPLTRNISIDVRL